MKSAIKTTVRWICLFSLAFSAALGFAQQAAPSRNGNDFPPLAAWKTAVASQDAQALKELYSTSPAARISSPEGEFDAEQDVAFWLGLKAKSLQVRVAQAAAPDPDLRQLVMEIEIHSAAPPSPKTLYVSAGEVWQHQGDAWRLIAVKRSAAARLQQPLSISNDIYVPGSDAHAKIARALAAASKQHKRVILVFGANWCYDCHVLDTAFHRPDLASVLAQGFEVVHIDVGRGDANQDLMEQYQVPMKKGIPGLAVLDSNGALVYSQKNGEFENARSLGPEDVLAFLNRWKPEVRQVLGRRR